MKTLHTALALLLLSAPEAARAGFPPSRAPLPIPAAKLLAPGVHVVSCGVDGHGATEAEALKACQAGVKAAPWIHKAPCACRRNAEIIEIRPDTAPAFWLAGWTHIGATPAQAWARCMTADAGDSYLPHGEDCELKSVYGPFERRHPFGEFDDASYAWLGSDGAWYDETGEGPCFTADTLVATPDGERPIAALDVGDAVVSWSPDGVAVETVGRVVRKKERAAAVVLALTFADGRVLRATPNHPLYSVSRGFVPAGELAPGEGVATRAGDGALVPVALTSVVEEPGPVVVFDLTVSPAHTLFAAGVWAHNY